MTRIGKRMLVPAALALALVVVLLCSRSGGREPAAVGAASFAPGTSLRYRVVLENRHTAGVAIGDAPAEPVTAEASLEGELVATVESKDDHGYLVTWRITSVAGGTFTLNRQPQIDRPEELARHLIGPQLVTEHDANGRLVRLHRDPKANELFTGTLELLAIETAFSRPPEPASEWTATEEAQLGQVETAYRATGDDTGIRIERERSRYTQLRGIPWGGDQARLGQELDATAAIELGADGTLQRFTSSDEVRITGPGGSELTRVTQRITLELVAIEAAPVRDRGDVVAGRAPAAVGSIARSDQHERRALVQRVGDLTWESLRDHVVHQGSATGARTHDVMWRGVALLRLHPELCRELPALLSGDDVSLDSRMLAFSILAGAGHGVAQEVMVEMLRSSWVEADPVAHRRLLQQFAFVARPTRAAAQHVLALHRARRDNIGIAATYTLGSMARHSRESGDAALSTELEAPLVAGIGGADDEDDVTAHIMGLGNAASAAHVTVMAPFAADERPEVRAAVARSLRHTPTQRAQELLVALSADRSGRVSRTAIRTLREHDPSARRDQELAELLGAGKVPPSAYTEALPLVRRLADPDLRRRALEHMLATAPLDTRLLAELRTSLGQARVN